MLERTASTYSTALAVCWWAGVCGFAMALIGAFAHVDALVQAGTCSFLSLFAGWGFVNGGVFVWGFVQAIRRHGWSVLFQSGWASIFYVAIMIFFIAFGGGMTWMIIKAAMHTPAAIR